MIKLSVRTWMLLSSLAVSGSLPVAAGSEIDFEKHVWPVLESQCISCHRAPYKDTSGRLRRPKGGLRLDSKSEMESAIDLIVAGKSGESLLFELVALPDDDPERMPQDADPLSQREIELLRRWIDGGASFGGWTGVGGDAVAQATAVTVEVPSRIRTLMELAEGVDPLSRAAREKSSGAVATIVDVTPDGSLVEVNFRSHESEVTDKDVQRLVSIKEHVTYLRLAKTAVGDGAVRSASKLPVLTRLDLTGTQVSTRGLLALSGHSALRYLNLRDTDVTDGVVETIAAIPNLESVYLFGTKVTDAGARKLSELRPDLYVQRGLRLPEGLAVEYDEGR